MTRQLNDCLTGITVPDFDGDLTVTLDDDDDTEFPLRCPAWCVVELTPLWGEGDVIGEFTDLGGIDGQLAQRIYRVGSRFDLSLLVTGAVGPLVDEDDDSVDYSTFVPYTDDGPWVGLETNLERLRENWLRPTLIGDGTRPHTLTMPSSDTREADVTVVPRMDLRDKLKWVHLYTVTLAVATGRFA